MEIKDYLIQSEKTLSPNFHYDKEFVSEPEIKISCNEFIKASQILDIVKKRKFYGKDVAAPYNLKDPEFYKSFEFKKDEGGEKVLHAALGIGTEAGEILEAVMKYKYDGQDLDVVNIKEELGDVAWYLAILLREFDLDLHEIMQNNIDKLKARYGEKFSEERANNRDLTTERNILDQGENKK